MIALTLALALMLGAGPECRVAVDYGPIGTGIATNRQKPPAPPPSPPSPPKGVPPVTWIRVHGRLLEAKLVKRVLPEYPKSACESGVAGTVHLLVKIGESGAISATRIIEGDPRLSPAAESAIKQWKYKPTVVNRDRVAVETNIYVRILPAPRTTGVLR